MPGKSPLPRSWSPSATTARQREIIRLLAIGTKVPDIARQLGGVTESAVRKLARRALIAQAKDLRTTDAFEAALALQMIRYEALLSAWFPRALALDKDAADVALKLLGQIADVNGFKSIRIETGGDDGTVRAPAEIVAAVLGRLEQLSTRFAEPPAIDSTAVEEPEQVEAT